MILFALN